MSKQIILSEKLVDILKNIEHRFSKILLESHQNKELVVDNSYIDSYEEEGMVTYLPAKRDQTTPENEKWLKGRQKVTFGKVVRAILAKKEIQFKDNELEDFVNEYKAQQADIVIKIVEGSDIIKWYKVSNYDDNYEGQGSLYGSCMRNVSKEYLDIYKKNCSMLCIINKKTNKLMARAILWKTANINDKDVPFLDRIYCVKPSLENVIKSYCRKNGWFYKTLQGAGNVDITNGSENIHQPKIKVKINKSINWEYGKKPYIDTLSFFGYTLENDGKLYPILTSFDNCNFKLQFRSTDGSYYNNSSHNGRKDIFNKRIEAFDRFLIKYDNGFAWIDDTDYSKEPGRRHYIIKLIKDSEELVEVKVDYYEHGLFYGLQNVHFLNGRELDKVQPYHMYLFDLFCDDSIFKPFKSYSYLRHTNFKLEDLSVEHFRMVISKDVSILSNYSLIYLEPDKIEVIVEVKPELIFNLSLNSFLNVSKKLKEEHIIKYLEKYPELIYKKGNIKVRLSKEKVKLICTLLGTSFTNKSFEARFGKGGTIIKYNYVVDSDDKDVILTDAQSIWFGTENLPTNTKVKIREVKIAQNTLFEKVMKILKIDKYEEIWKDGVVQYSMCGERGRSMYVRVVMGDGNRITIDDLHGEVHSGNFVIVERSLSECVYSYLK